jgi:hypothetical protein
MAIGDAFPHNVPAVGASGTQYATDMNEVVQELIDRTSVPIPFSALAGNELDMGNVPVINARYFRLYDQASSPGASPVNRFESYEGEVYWINSSGALKMTNAGSLNASGLGGIGGDYGGVNPALVTFIDAGTRYDFYDDFAGLIWAYTRCRGVDIAAGATSVVYAQLRYGGLASLTFTLPATLPGANRSVVVISNTGQLAFNDSTDTVTNDIVLGGSTKIQHGTRTVQVPIVNYATTAGAIGNSIGYPIVSGANATVVYYIAPTVGQTLTSVTVRTLKGSVANTEISLVRRVDNVATVLGGGAATDGTIGVRTVTKSGLSEVVTTLYSYYILIVLPATNDAIYAVEYTYTQGA